MRVFAVVLLGGCWSSSPAPVAPRQAALPPLPRCPIELTEASDEHPQQRLIVNGVDLGALAAEEVGGGTIELATYQTGNEAWVSYRGPHDHHGPRGWDTMWKVSCDGAKLDTFTLPGADFGNAALHPDRRRLYFSSGSVNVLDLATRKRMSITKPGSTIHGCWDSGEKHGLADSVSGVTADHVEFSRGAPCGFEADYDGVLMRRHLETGVEERSTRIGAVVEVAGEIWIGSGECDSSVHRSSDWKTWTQVALPTTFKGPLALRALRGQPDQILAKAEVCGYEGGGGLILSQDHGKTWKDVGEVEQTLPWNGKTLAEAASELDGWPKLPQSKTIRGRRVTLTNFGLLDTTTGERLFPR